MKIPKVKNLKRWPKILRSRRIIVAMVAVVLIIFFATRGGADKDKIKTVQVTEKTLETQVAASGKIQSENQASLRFQTTGKLAWIGVKEGNYVYAGQAIASLDTQDLQKRLQRDLNSYFKTRLDFEDVKDSQKDKVITDTLKRIAQRSQADLDNSVIQVELEDLAIKFSKLLSPINGYIVDKEDFFAGENVFPTDTIVTVADFGKMQFVAEVDETDIGKIRQDQKVKINIDALPDKIIEASIILIGPKAITTSTGATAFEVKINLKGVEDLRLGMNGEAKIVIESISNALVAPLDAIVQDRYVWVKKDDTYQKREIEKGLEGDLEIQIVSGLEKDETVVTDSFDQIGKKNLAQKILSFFK